MPWEHTVIEAEPGRSLDLVGSLNRLAAEGWEVVGFGTVARGSVGYTIMSALLRRWYEPLPPPTVTDPAWLPDPAGRHQGRWWTGSHWSVRVIDGKKETTDKPAL